MITSINGPLRTAQDLGVQIARGQVSGAKPVGSFGERTASANETNRIIWANGVFELPPAAGVQMSIASTSANDAAAGTHAREIEIHYLDADLKEQTDMITLAGLTPVLTTATNIRFINEIHVHDVGANAFAEGTITASNTGIVYGQINALDTRSTSSMRMVPANKRCMVAGAVGGSVSGTAAAGVVVHLVASELIIFQHVDPLILFPYGSVAVQDTSESFNFPVPLPFRAGTVIGLSLTTDKAAIVTGSWYGWIEDV